MRIYQTTDMEAALRRMVAVHDKVVVFNKHWCKCRIRLRDELISDLPTISASPIRPLWDRQLAKWNKKKGVLFYTPNLVIDKLPDTPAMLFVEAPLSCRTFLQYITRVEKEVVVYRPPNWEFQEEKLTLSLPKASELEAVLAVAEGLKDEPLNDVELAAARVTGFDRVFTYSHIKSITGLTQPQVPKLFTRGFSGNFRWYVPYTLLLAPEEDWLLAAYNTLADQLERGLLRSDKFNGSAMEMQMLRRQGYVRRGDPVYCLRNRHRPPDFHLMDAINNARRADWYKMKMIVESSVEFDLNGSAN